MRAGRRRQRGHGYGRNVNVGLRLASGEFIAVVNNDCRLFEGDVYDLCVHEAVTSPLVIGERQGLGESIEPGGFHGSFWVVPRTVFDRVGFLDERYERAYWEDDDFLARLRQTGIRTLQVASVRVKHTGGLTTVKDLGAPEVARAERPQVREEVGLAPVAATTLSQGRRRKHLALLSKLSELATHRFDEATPANDYGPEKAPASTCWR